MIYLLASLSRRIHRFESGWGRQFIFCVRPRVHSKIQLLKIITLVISCLSLCACATTELVIGPDVTPHQLVKCMDIENCYEDAAKVCGGKYKIVNTASQVSGDANSTSSSTSLLVRCEN